MDKGLMQDRIYEEEAISLKPRAAQKYTPRQYRIMRRLEISNPFSKDSSAQIFYLQAKYMENFEDDHPYEEEVFCLSFPPSYKDISLAELRGYFTWRTKLRRGRLDKTSMPYAFIYIYELINQIGCTSKEDGFEKLTWFCEQYGVIDPNIKSYARRWIIDYAIYYNLPVEKILKYFDITQGIALDTLRKPDTSDDQKLFDAILKLSSYSLIKSKAYKLYPNQMMRVICAAYRTLDENYRQSQHLPYADKLFGKIKHESYYPFESALFFNRESRDRYEYIVGPGCRYLCVNNSWSVESQYERIGKSVSLGDFVRTADRLLREDLGINVRLKPRNENEIAVKCILKAIELESNAIKTKIEFDLSKLGNIRQSSESIGQKLMTEEERCAQEELSADDANTKNLTPQGKGQSPHETLLTGNEFIFMRILLYGGDLREFLVKKHLMASILAETVNSILYDEFADTVIEFDGDMPVIVNDYLEDLKGMIPN